MSIIDEKGKIFGKINIIDFLVILFLVCIMPAFYFGYKIYTKEPEMGLFKKEFIEIEIDCFAIKINPKLLKIISVGDKELDENGHVIGEIVSLGKPEPYEYKLDIGKGQELVKKDVFLKQIKVKFKLKVGIIDQNIYYKDKEIKADIPFDFKTNEYNLIIHPIGRYEEDAKEKVETETVSVILRIKCSNISPELAKIIKPGDKEMEFVKANIKKITARIIKVVSNEPAEVISLMGDKREWSIVGHPKYRDVVLDVEIFCERSPLGLFKGNSPIKVGNHIVFSTYLYSIEGMIIGIEDR